MLAQLAVENGHLVHLGRDRSPPDQDKKHGTRGHRPGGAADALHASMASSRAPEIDETRILDL